MQVRQYRRCAIGRGRVIEPRKRALACRCGDGSEESREAKQGVI